MSLLDNWCNVGDDVDDEANTDRCDDDKDVVDVDVVVDDDDDIKDCVVKSFIIIPNSFSAAATMSSDAIKMFSSILISLSDE